jgi:hypothetical protein
MLRQRANLLRCQLLDDNPIPWSAWVGGSLNSGLRPLNKNLIAGAATNDHRHGTATRLIGVEACGLFALQQGPAWR